MQQALRPWGELHEEIKRKSQHESGGQYDSRADENQGDDFEWYLQHSFLLRTV